MEKEAIENRIKEIEGAMTAADFWSNPAEAQAMIKELQDLKVEAEGGGKKGARKSCETTLNVHVRLRMGSANR